MAQVPAWRRYARFFGVDVSSDVDEELRFHLEEKTRALMAKGLTPAEARAEAQRQFGELIEVRRLCELWGHTRERTIERRHYWTGWGQDVRYAVRMLCKTPLITFVAALSIALGIGANTAIFTVLDQVLLRKLPVADPDRLVRVQTTGFFYGSTNGSGRELSHPLYLDFRDHNEVFSGIFGLWNFTGSVNAGDRPEMAHGELITGTYFSTLGVGAIRGRVIGPDDDRVTGGHSVVVISHAYWLRRFAAAPDIVGRKLTIANQPMTIIGVAEPGFDGASLSTATQFFVPMMMDAQITRAQDRLTDRGSRWMNVFARLAPGVTPEQAAARLQPFYRAVREQELQAPRFTRASALTRQRFLNENQLAVVPAPEGHTPSRGDMRRPLWILMAIVCGVLLIACANVANLLLARGAARRREIALRLSLGATRGRIVRQLLIESLMLALVGGAGGVFLATAGANLLLGVFVDPETVNLIRATPDARILAFTFAVVLLTGLLFGLVPAFQSTRPALAPTLKDLAGSVLGGGHGRLRKGLVVSQIALSLLLLIGAGLFIRSLNGLLSFDLGFKPDHLVMFGADPGQSGYRDMRTKQFAIDLLAKVRATPGVSGAGFASVPLLWGGWWGSSIAVEGYVPKENENVSSRCNAVSPGYFEALGIPLLMGRDFHEGDFHDPGPASTADSVAAEGYRVAIVTESFAKRYLPGNPIGRHIGFGADPGTPTPIEVVGVVRDSTYSGPGEERQWQLYFPYLEGRDPGMTWFYVRTGQDPAAILPAMRRAVHDVDPNVPVMTLRTIEAQMQRALVNERLVTGLSTIFGLLATLLSMVGLYGVMAYGVARRTREIGVRMALGARAPRVAWLILREALIVVAIGVAIALPTAWWLSRYLRSELHGVTPTDPATIAIAVIALTAVAAAAALIPATRAARLNPIRALRCD